MAMPDHPPISRLGFTFMSREDNCGDPELVMIFVHGLRGNPQTTWTGKKRPETDHPSSKCRKWRWLTKRRSSRASSPAESSSRFCWPRDDLPKRLPNVQIVLYGYDADVIGLFQVKSQNTISIHSNNFLNQLERNLPKHTPVIFVAHSLGGILVKDVLVRSSCHFKPKFHSIHRNTRGVVFMGTPHGGSDMAHLAQIVVNIGRVTGDPNTQLLRGLCKDSEILGRIHEDFMKLLAKPDFEVFCFQEDRSVTWVPKLTGLVVDKESSRTSSVYEDYETVAANHMDMVRFSGPTDENYVQVSDALVSFVNGIINRSPAPRAQVEPQAAENIPLEQRQLYEVPFRPNTRFCGREGVLRTLHEVLTNDAEPQHPTSRITGRLRSCLLHGMGGVGKTQVALEYTYRYRGTYDFIFWIHSENQTVLASSINKISNSLSLHTASTAVGTTAIAETLRKWLEKIGNRWLVVFDNTESWSTVEPCLPRTGHGAIIITSQNDQLVPQTNHDILLKPLDSTEGSELMIALLPKTGVPYDINDAKKISSQLGGLPLALGVMAGIISQTKWSLEELLEYSANRQGSARIFEMSPPTTIHAYERSLAMVWEWQKLEPDQLKIIQILSMLNPDGTPESLLYADHEEPELAFLKSSNVRIEDFSTTIGALATRHLISREIVAKKPQLIMHRSLQKSVLHNLDKDPRLLQQVFDLAFALIRKVYPKQSPTHDPQNDQWEIQELYQPHIICLHSAYKSGRRPIADIRFAELLSDAVYYFWERGMHGSECAVLTDTAEEICATYPQASYVTRANVYSLGAVVRWGRGITQREPILSRFLTALALLQKHINEVPPNQATPEVLRLYATSWNDVGQILMDYESYEDAIQCLDLCATIKQYLNDELGVLGANRNKALALAWLGRVNEALKLIPDEDQLLPKLLDQECASYYERCRFAWANVFLLAGELEKAYKILKENIKSRKRLCGKSGHYTLDSYYLLGMTLRRMGKKQEAIKYFRKALDNPTEWSEESKCLAKFQLSKTLADISQHEDSCSFSTEAEIIRRGLWDSYATYLNVAGGNDDESYDHLAPSEMGRTTIRKFRASGKLSKLMKACEDIQKKLNNQSGGEMLTSVCCEMCKSPELDISEASAIYGMGLRKESYMLISMGAKS